MSSVQCPIIVGRDDVLEQLDRAVTEVARGRGRTLFLSGPAGIGKTRLMWATARKADAAKVRVGAGSVAPQDHAVPLASIREFATGIRAEATWGTLSADLIAIDGRHDGDGLGARRLIVRAVADRILETIDRPTMLIFQDLHWTDEMSLEVIGELARHVDGRPLLLVCDYRGDELPVEGIHKEWRARLLSQRFAEEIKLRPFTADETGLATTLILGGELPAPREVVEAVHERTNGIPLHIEELIAVLGPEERTDGKRIRDASVPDTIADAVIARVNRLAPETRTLIQAGAVIGRCFSPDVIAGMVDRPLEEIEPSIQELVDAGILYPFDYVDQGYYDFNHQLLRDAIYASVPPSQRRRFHAQAAEFVMTLESASVVHASRHYEQAGLRPEAFRSAMTGAREASRISARQEAYELYERAIANMPPELTVAEQADLYSQFSQAAGAIEHNEECSEAAARARELYLQAGRPIEAADMLTLVAMRDTRGGSSVERYMSFTSQALAEVDAVPPSEERDRMRAYLLGIVADQLFRASRLDEARDRALEAHELAESVGDRETVLECDILIARMDIVAGRYETGMRDGMTAAREARDAGYESVGVTGYRNLGIMALRILDPDSAEIAVAEGWQYADAIEQSHCRQMLSCTTALLDWGAGHWDDADARARQQLVDRGCRRGVAGSEDVIGLVALGRGRLAEARRWFGDSLGAGQGMEEIEFILTPLWGLAETDLADGRLEDAIGHCEEGYAASLRTDERALFIPFVVTGTRAYLAARRPEDAERWLERARDHLVGWEPVAGPALSHAKGLLRVAAGSLSGGREALERAVRGWDERKRIWEATWARLDLARCLIRMNRHVDAAGVLAQVRTAALAIQSDPLLTQMDELARVGRGRGTIEEPWYPLTAREFEVARLVAEGMTNAEIAEHLTIAPKTASAHIEHILAKLGVTRRAEIAAWAAGVAVSANGGPSSPADSSSGAAAAVRR
jgi:DNA-binding CsgD family transcriptional regulator/tetratricopeptide (TPR) repeat protein